MMETGWQLKEDQDGVSWSLLVDLYTCKNSTLKRSLN
jgi:hypothetical protein